MYPTGEYYSLLVYKLHVSLVHLYGPLLNTYLLNTFNFGFIKPTMLLSWSIGFIQPGYLEVPKTSGLEVASWTI